MLAEAARDGTHWEQRFSIDDDHDFFPAGALESQLELRRVPAPGETVTITSLGTDQAALAGPIQSVSLLGSDAALAWSQTATGLRITSPASMPFNIAVGFKIVSRPAAP